MILAEMIKVDEHALICDLAETYQIYDYRQMPPDMVAIFAIGLRDNSRIKMKLANVPIDIQTTLLAAAVDNLALMIWQRSGDSSNRPKSVLSTLLAEPKVTDITAFASGKDFEEERNRILAKVGGGN